MIEKIYQIYYINNVRNNNNKMIVSLGGNCALCHQLIKYDLRRYAFPFDWCKIKIDQLKHVLDNLNKTEYITFEIKKFSENHPFLFFKENEMEIKQEEEPYTKFEEVLKNSEFLKKSEKDGSYILQNKYKIEFAHELIKEKDLSEFKKIMETRFDRFLNIPEILEKDEKIYFLYFEPNIKNVKKDATNYQIVFNKLKQIFGSSSRQIHFYIIYSSLGEKDKDLEQYLIKFQKNTEILLFQIFKLNEKYDFHWTYDFLDWEKLFLNIF